MANNTLNILKTGIGQGNALLLPGQSLVSPNGQYFVTLAKGGLALRVNGVSGFAYWYSHPAPAENFALALDCAGKLWLQPLGASRDKEPNRIGGTPDFPCYLGDYRASIDDAGGFHVFRDTGAPEDKLGMVWSAPSHFYRDPRKVRLRSALEAPNGSRFLAVANVGPELQGVFPLPRPVGDKPPVIIAEKGSNGSDLWTRVTWYKEGVDTGVAPFALQSQRNGLFLSGKSGKGQNVQFVSTLDEWAFWRQGSSGLSAHDRIWTYLDEGLYLNAKGEAPYSSGCPLCLWNWPSKNETNALWNVE